MAPLNGPTVIETDARSIRRSRHNRSHRTFPIAEAWRGKRIGKAGQAWQNNATIPRVTATPMESTSGCHTVVVGLSRPDGREPIE